MYSLHMPTNYRPNFPAQSDALSQAINKFDEFEFWYRDQFQIKTIPNHTKKMLQHKKLHNLVCLIEDERIENIYNHCGFLNMPLYINLPDNCLGFNHYINDFYVKKTNTYSFVIGAKQYTWFDIWKSIDDIVKINGDENKVVISYFKVSMSRTKNAFKYVTAVLKNKSVSLK